MPEYLIDGVTPVGCGFHWSILAHSPEREKFKAFMKEPPATPILFMPPFELAELLLLRQGLARHQPK